MRRSRGADRQIVLLTGERLAEAEKLGRYVVTRVEGWSELIQRLPRFSASTVLVVEPYLGSERAPTEFWQALTLFPSIPVIAAVLCRAPLRLICGGCSLLECVEF